METQGTPHVIDFEREHCIHKITELLRNCQVSFCDALFYEIEELLDEQPSLRLDPEMEA